METPRQKSATETLALISMFFEKHCQLHDGRNLVCAHCGGEIRSVRAYLSLHDAPHVMPALARDERGAWTYPAALPARTHPVAMDAFT